MKLITGGGALTNRNIADLNANFQEVAGATTGPTFWVRPQASISNAPAGTLADPFPSFSALGAAGVLVSGAVINFEGVTFEQWTTPLGINNVSIVGAQVTPRQATTSGVPNGSGATWMTPSNLSNTLPCIRVQGQGWTIANVYFNSSATTNGCIQPYTTGDPPTAADGAHLLIDNCILTGAAYGVYASGGTNFVTIQNSSLFGFSGSGDVAIAQTAGAGIGTLLGWKVLNCRFWGNATNIVMPFNQGIVMGCVFTNGTAANINLTGGTAPNFIQQNVFNIAAADFDPAGGTTGVTGDAWSNYLTDAVETGLPAN